MSEAQINVSSSSSLGRLISQTAEALEKHREAIIVGINSGIPSAINLVEIIKHRVAGLHQLNSFEKVSDSNKTRVVIKLSLNPLNPQDKGYQAPIPAEEVETKTFEELKVIPRINREETKERVNTRGEGRGRRGQNIRGRRGDRGSRRGGRNDRSGKPDKRQNSSGRNPRNNPRNNARPQVTTEKEPNDILINFRTPPIVFVKETLTKLKTGSELVHVKASGSAIPKAVKVVEEVKRKEAGLHQFNDFSSRDVKMVFEERKGEVQERKVIGFVITLSKAPINNGTPGYQPPIPESEVTPMTLEEVNKL